MKEPAMSIAWEPSMETGAPQLDAQRRALVERANSLLASIETGGDRSSIESAMLDFGNYSVRHFSQEEDCRLRGSCPALQWNGAARAELIKIVAGFRESYERNGASPRLAEDLSCELSGWVARYIPGPVTTLPCVTTPK
jgi:hemerythrin-like metal-binding protein